MLLNFEFLVILNLFVLLLWPPYLSPSFSGQGKNTFGIVVLIMTVAAVVLDIFFIVLKLAAVLR